MQNLQTSSNEVKTFRYIYPLCFLTAYKSCDVLPVLAWTSDSETFSHWYLCNHRYNEKKRHWIQKNPDPYYSYTIKFFFKAEFSF